MSALKVSVLSLTSKYMGVDLECQLFRMLPNRLLVQMSAKIYNRRPKALFVHTDMLCKHLIEWCLIVDNMPLDVCKFNRSFSKKTYYSSFRQRLLNIAASLLLRIYYMPFAHWIRSFVTLTYRKLWSASECLASFVNATDARTDILNLLYSTFSNI